MIISGFALPWIRLFWIGSLLPGLAAAGTARLIRELRAWLYKVALPHVHKWQQEAQRDHDWEADWVREYDPQHRQRQRTQSQPFGGGGRNEAQKYGDAKGYYRILSVTPSASVSEIQAAFRAAALKHHPDMQKQGGSTGDSTALFQQLQV